MSKIKVSIINKTTLRLDEDAKKGDEIDLHDLQSVDSTFINEAISNQKDDIYKSKIELVKSELEKDKKLALAELESKYKETISIELSKKSDEILKLEKEYTDKLSKLNEEKSKISTTLSLQNDSFNTEKKLIEEKIKSNFEVEKQKLQNEIEQITKNIEQQKIIIESEVEKKIIIEYNEKLKKAQEEISEKKLAIESLQGKIEKAKLEKETAIQAKEISIKEEISKKDLEIQKLLHQVEEINHSKAISEQNLKTQYELEIRKQVEITESYKDFRRKLSTKMLGETLEQHCEIEFNNVRTLGFQDSYFEKDNDAKDGTKGDYIFRDFDENGIEIISIMFEMKNEGDETVSKQKNTDFLEKLNKDRINKNCEYAVLVTMLEADNELYNRGIVDVSYKFDKMFIIRPQFFIVLITLLRNAALKTVEAKKELEQLKNQNIDITNFENRINDFKMGFSRNYTLASEHFRKAIDEIDKTIKGLNNTKEYLEKSLNQLRIANDKAEDLSIKKLTKDSPSLQKQFEEESKKE